MACISAINATGSNLNLFKTPTNWLVKSGPDSKFSFKEVGMVVSQRQKSYERNLAGEKRYIQLFLTAMICNYVIASDGFSRSHTGVKTLWRNTKLQPVSFASS